MKLRLRSTAPIIRTADSMLSGIVKPIMMVGRRVNTIPLSIVGRRFNRNTNTTRTANTKPRAPSRWTVVSCSVISGPLSKIVMISTSSGRTALMASSRSPISWVTSTVLASGDFMTMMPKLGLPFVREIVVALSVPRATSATSESRTGLPEGTPPSNPTTSSRISFKEPYSLAVLTKKDTPR